MDWFYNLLIFLKCQSGCCVAVNGGTEIVLKISSKCLHLCCKDGQKLRVWNKLMMS